MAKMKEIIEEKIFEKGKEMERCNKADLKIDKKISKKEHSYCIKGAKNREKS